MASHSNGQRLAAGELARKRKGRDVFALAHPVPESPYPISSPKAETVPFSMAPPLEQQQQQIPAIGGGGGKLLAGYLAHEFLTKGTLFGRHWDPAAARFPARACHQPSAVADQPQQGQEEREQTKAPETEEKEPAAAYVEVAYLLKAEGGGVPGVVNPTELARWLQM